MVHRNVVKTTMLAPLILAILSLLGQLCSGTIEHSGDDLEFTSRHDSFSFLVLGDWGMGSDVQKSIAEVMHEKVQAAGDTAFVLNVGDNFYKDEIDEKSEKQGGVDGVDDPLWTDYFENMYRHTLIKDIPFVSVLGNHDYMGSVQAQLSYA